MHRPSLIRSCLLLVVLLGIGRTAASGPESPLATRAAEVESALAAGDMQQVRALAKDRRVDPFLVAEVLRFRSLPTAVAYAKASEDEQLISYVGGLKIAPAGSAGAKLLLGAYAALQAAEWPVLLEGEIGTSDRVLQAARLQLRGRALKAEGRHAECAEHLVASGDRAQRIDWLLAARYGYQHGALQARRAGDFELARSGFNGLATLEERLGSPRRALQARFFLANLDAELGLLPGAQRQLDALVKAHEADTSRKTNAGLARVRGLRAAVFRRQGEYGRALVEVERALALTRRPVQRARFLGERGNVQWSAGDAESARKSYLEAYTFVRTANRPDWSAELLQNIGLAQMTQGAHADAREALQASLALFEETKNLRGACVVRLSQAHLELEDGHVGAALALSRLAVHDARRLGDEWTLANALHGEGAVLNQKGRHAEAIDRFKHAIDAARRVKAQSVLLDAWLGIAEARLGMGTAPQALVAAMTAIQILNQMVVGLGEAQGAQARERHVRLFEVAVDAAVAENNLKDLAGILEEARAMTLLESLEGRDTLREQVIPSRFLEREAKAQAGVARARTVLQRTRSGRSMKAARRAFAALNKALSERESIVETIRREARYGVGLVYPQVDSLAQIRSGLGDEEVYVLFGAGRKTYIALVVTPEKARLVPLGSRKTIDDTMQALTAAVQDPTGDVEPTRAEMTKLVIDPLQLPATVRRVLLSPTGPLFELPPGLMFPSQEVALVPSATTQRTLATEAALRGKQVLAFGDPLYPKSSGLERLPETATEAKAVGDIVVLRAKATEQGLREKLNETDRLAALHLACHGLVDMAYPMRTALALTPDTIGDGYLSVLDVFSLKVDADLVVLSACESGRGRVFNAEGIVGLTRAFMHAGAPRVISSLWKVDDAATRALMTKFYELWAPSPKAEAEPKRRRPGAAEALRAAQAFVRDHPDHPEWRHPYYWAAWVLWGLPK